MKRTLIHNVILVNEGTKTKGSVIIENEQVAEVFTGDVPPTYPYNYIVDGRGYYLLPGIIDDHVHFRDPGMTHKADIFTESRAAVAGGVTSVMDMPNTVPQTIKPDILEDKFRLMAEKSLVNYSCYYGATNDNYKDFGQLDPKRVCGIKLFMGSSTGGLLVDKRNSLFQIFNGTDLLIAVHCESQDIIRKNIEEYKKYTTDINGVTDIPLRYHPDIRSVEACYESSKLAVELATEAGARLHILHITTAKELELFQSGPLKEKRITAEVCIPHLMFNAADYEKYGTQIKCNPAIKSAEHQEALKAAVNSGLIDVIGTDHAPHLPEEKRGGALKAMSGTPSIQYSLVSMLELVDKGVFTLETLVQKMCHAPADIYSINGRGYIRPGYKADLVLVKPDSPWTVTNDSILSKCKWSPFENHTFNWKVEKTFVNGHVVYSDGQTDDTYRGQELRFR